MASVDAPALAVRMLTVPQPGEASSPAETADRCAEAMAELDRCEPLLLTAIADGFGEHDLAGVKASLTNGSAQLWTFHGGCMVTSIRPATDGTRALHAWLVGGEPDAIRDAEPRLAAFARAKGCKRLAITAPRTRLASLGGFTRAGIAMTKGL